MRATSPRRSPRPSPAAASASSRTGSGASVRDEPPGAALGLAVLLFFVAIAVLAPVDRAVPTSTRRSARLRAAVWRATGSACDDGGIDMRQLLI